MSIPCQVILDLIPLVKDGVASAESTKIVDEHIQSCESCQAEFLTFATIKPDQPPLKDAKILSAIKRSIMITQMIILTAGAVIGVALSDSMGMFYNLLIMPVIGGVSISTDKRKWYLAPIAIFVLTYSWQTIAGIVDGGFNWNAFHRGLFFSILYTALVGLGVIITLLLKFAFKKER